MCNSGMRTGGQMNYGQQPQFGGMQTGGQMNYGQNPFQPAPTPDPIGLSRPPGPPSYAGDVPMSTPFGVEAPRPGFGGDVAGGTSGPGWANGFSANPGESGNDFETRLAAAAGRPNPFQQPQRQGPQWWMNEMMGRRGQ